MGLISENNIIKEIAKYFGDDFLGMTGTDESMTIALKDEKITINNIKINLLKKLLKK